MHRACLNTARYLNVSRPQVYALVSSGELPAIKLGGRGVWRIDRRQQESYLERLLEETREWAKAHPLAKEEDVTTAKREGFLEGHERSVETAPVVYS